MGSSMEIDRQAAGIAVALCLLWRLVSLWRARQLSPAILFPSLDAFSGFSARGHTRWAKVPRRMECFALLCLLIALANPRLFIERPHDPLPPTPPESSRTQGIAIYFILDQSGSMEGPVIIQGDRGGREKVTKIALLKKLTKAFIQGDPRLDLKGRPSDMIGIVAFARSAQVLAPLTLDHRILRDQLDKLDIVRNKDQDGTAIGYAVFKTVNLIAATRHYADLQKGGKHPSYTIKNSVMILVTDGLQDPNPLDLDNRWRGLDPVEAGVYAKKNNVRLYLVNVDPSNNKPEYKPGLDRMRRMAEMTGGKFFMVDNTGNLGEIYREIDRLEKSEIPFEQDMLKNLQKQLSKEDLPAIYKMYAFYPYLIALALVSLMVAQLLKATLSRSIP